MCLYVSIEAVIVAMQGSHAAPWGPKSQASIFFVSNFQGFLSEEEGRGVG